MLKKLLSYVVVLTLIASYFIYNADADEVDNDCLSLPVQLFDFDADGLFYEYELFQGMDKLNGTQSNLAGATKGLINDALNNNGQPVYKKETVENAAKMIQANLVSGKSNSAYRGHDFPTFKYFSENKGKEKKGDGIYIEYYQHGNSTQLDSSSIQRGQWIYLYFSSGNTNGLNLIIKDSNDIQISSIDLNTAKVAQTGWKYLNVYIPSNPDNENEIVKFEFSSTNGCNISDLSITPKGDVLPLGDYDTTVSRYNAGGLTTIENCESCMDYAYLRLTNFFNPDFYLNKKDNTYNSMVLKKNGTSYIFDSNKKIEYKQDNHTFYNVDGTTHGFFPLDHIGEEFYHENCGNNHNYHFGMIIDGNFTYKSGANQIFKFTGDDDVYVFINNELVVDLGGAHEAVEASIEMDKLSLTNNQTYSFKLFYLERRTTDSNCKIETNISLTKNVNYKFVSGTEGKELPEVIVRKTPSDANKYYDGDTATIEESNRTFEDVVVADGVWKFISWDNTSITIPEKNTFVGTWVFTPKTIDNENNNSSNENTDPDEGNQEDKKPTIEGNDKDDKKPEVTDKKDTDKKDSINKVKTGDSTVISIYLVMMMVACLGVIHILKKD